MTLRSGRRFGASSASAAPGNVPVERPLRDPLSRPLAHERVLDRTVSEQTLRTLRAADEVIRFVAQQLPDGAGNQRADVVASRGVSAGRCARARELMPITGGPIDLARAAARAGGGNCGEITALAAARLLSGARPMPVMSAWVEEPDHSFLLLGDPRASGDAVVVDAWVTRPQAHLWRDSAWKAIVDQHGFDSVQTWNPGRAMPEFDTSAIQPEAFSVAKARAQLGVPDTEPSLVNWVHRQCGDYSELPQPDYATTHRGFVRYREG